MRRYLAERAAFEGLLGQRPGGNSDRPNLAGIAYSRATRPRRLRPQTTEERIAALARAEVNYVEQAVPELVYMIYDGPNEIFVDPLTGESLDRDAARSQLARLVAGAETPGAFDPVRLGTRTMSRYSAEKAALAGVLGRADGESDNRKPNLVPAAYSRATRPRIVRPSSKVTG